MDNAQGETLPAMNGASVGASGTAISREEKYQQILSAAVEVIAENGFANSRVSEIAARAGVADGTIYLYFKNKDQILMAALDERVRFFPTSRAGAAATYEAADEKLKMVIHLHLEAMGANRALAVVSADGAAAIGEVSGGVFAAAAALLS